MSSGTANEPFVFTPAAVPGPAVGRDPLVNETRREIAEIVGEIASAVHSDRTADEFLALLVDRILNAMAAEGVMVWQRNGRQPQKGYRCIKRLGHVTDQSIPTQSIATHSGLLLDVASQGKPVFVPATPGATPTGATANPMQVAVALVPIECEASLEGAEYLLEVFLEPDCDVATQRGYLRFVAQLADLAGEFLRAVKLRRTTRLDAIPGGRLLASLALAIKKCCNHLWRTAGIIVAVITLLIAVAVSLVPLVVHSPASIRPANVETIPAPHDAVAEAIHVRHDQRVSRSDEHLTIADPALALTMPAPASAHTAGIEVHDCAVRFAQEVKVPALETGRVAEVFVAPNDMVTVGAPIARLDDRSMLIRRRASMLRLNSARSDASDDFDIRYAELALAEAEAELEMSRSIQNDVRGGAPLSQVRRLKLAVERGQLELAQVKRIMKRAENEAELCEADLAVIDDQLRNFHAESPIGGVVLEVTRSAGEWIEQGESIATVGRIDRLHVHALVSSEEISPATCRGLPVSVHWTDRRWSNEQSLRGRVLSVDPQVLPGGRFCLHAEIVNRAAENDPSQWLLQPGAEVEMKVYASVATKYDRSRSFRR